MNLSDRMKNYERVNNTSLISRLPIILRLDGKNFHRVIRQLGFTKPFDKIFHNILSQAAWSLTDELDFSFITYIQSDEVSIALFPYRSLESTPPYSGRIQKLVSISSSILTSTFIRKYFFLFPDKVKENLPIIAFDARVFCLPNITEVGNYFLWRQQDAVRNSINSQGQQFYSHKELMGVPTKKLQSKMLEEKDFNWNNLPKEEKQGTLFINKLRSNYTLTNKEDFSLLLKETEEWLNHYIGVKYE